MALMASTSSAGVARFPRSLKLARAIENLRPRLWCCGGLVAVAVAVGALSRAEPAEPTPLTFRGASSSMEPTLHCAAAPGCRSLRSDQVLVKRERDPSRELERWDIVVFKLPAAIRRCGAGTRLIKRIVALPREGVRQIGGQLYVDGVVLKQPFLAPHVRRGSDFPTVRMDRHHYFVMGDNRESSCDSRSFGPIPSRYIQGKVVFVQRFSPSRIR